MRRKAKKSLFFRIVVPIGTALAVFLIIYLGWVFYDIHTRYSNAVHVAELHAHTIIGREGYEYIFEPSTQILIDKIKTNPGDIIFYVFLKDYLPFHIEPECPFQDQGSCTWLDIHLFYGHDPRPLLRKIILYAAVIALFFAFVTQALRSGKSF